MSKCTEIKLVEKLPSGTDVLNVVIDGTTSAYWFFDYAKAMEFVGKDVIVEYRQEVYKGDLVQCINTFVTPNVVTTLDKQSNIKLYVDQEDNFSNVSFSEIEVGERRPGAIVYCTHSEYKSSNAAVWMELIIRDRSMHTAKLRLFDYQNKDINFSGKYVMTELVRSKYGFQSEVINPVPGEDKKNPEIPLAIQFIKNYFADDPVTLDYLSKTNLLNTMEDIIDYEKGYSLMRLAMELAIVDGMNNISKDVDLKAIGIALLVENGHLLKNSVLSSYFNNVALALNFKWPNRDKVLQLIDAPADDPIDEYVIMQSIKNMVDTLLKIRKGIAEC